VSEIGKLLTPIGVVLLLTAAAFPIEFIKSDVRRCLLKAAIAALSPVVGLWAGLPNWSAVGIASGLVVGFLVSEWWRNSKDFGGGRTPPL